MNFKIPKSVQRSNKPIKFIISNTPIKIQTDSASKNQQAQMTNKAIPKPDFSPFEEKETNISSKPYSSYKKNKIIFPETPIKSPCQKYFTPITKAVSKNLFGNNNDNTNNVFRKLNFDTCSSTKLESSIICNESLAMKLRLQPSVLIEKKSENFEFINKISNGKFGVVYKCKKKDDDTLYAIKKSINFSNTAEYHKIRTLIKDLHSYNNIYSQFTCEYFDCWIEEENLTRTLYISMPYCENGDLLCYLGRLEETHYSFSNEFYWNIIFEMLCGVFSLHQRGYLHLDIKPDNFIVDSNGKIRLTDYGLSQKKKEIISLHDITEGDVSYLSPEVFYQENLNKIDEKSDVFSLGLSILEILFKIELPKNGKLWREMREENFDISSMFNSINNEKQKEYIDLIEKMVCGYKKRKTIDEIFNDESIKEINIRYVMLLKGEYKGNGILLLNEIQSEVESNSACTPRNTNKNFEYY